MLLLQQQSWCFKETLAGAAGAVLVHASAAAAAAAGGDGGVGISSIFAPSIFFSDLKRGQKK